MWLELAAVAAVLLTMLVLHCRRKLQYWTELGVYTASGLPIIGNILYNMNVIKMRHEWMDEEYRKARDRRMIGLYEFLSPSLSVHDPNLVMSICVKDFDHFVDRRSVDLKGTDSEIFNDILTNATGNHWKSLRALMTPTFTSGKMKDMFHLIQEISTSFIKRCKEVRDENSIVSMKEYFSNYTMDVIACCAFGLETGTLEGKNKEFITNANNAFKTSFTQIIKTIIFMTAPKLARLLKLQFLTKAMMYLEKVAREAIKAREQGVHRGDFLDLLLEARENSNNTEKGEEERPTKKMALKDSTIVAQSILFLLAGFDTTATTLSFAAALLARNPACQVVLREEIKNKVKNNENGRLTYQDLMECKYLDAVLSETLRLYPPAHVVERKCTKDYLIPDTSITVKKNMYVSIPVYSLHHDQKFFPDPEAFEPTRFLPENKGNIPSGVYLPFGVGPRMCIAERFARMEAKLVLADLILNFELSVPAGCEKIKLAKVPGILRPEPESVKIALKDVTVQ